MVGGTSEGGRLGRGGSSWGNGGRGGRWDGGVGEGWGSRAWDNGGSGDGGRRSLGGGRHWGSGRGTVMMLVMNLTGSILQTYVTKLMGVVMVHGQLRVRVVADLTV